MEKVFDMFLGLFSDSHQSVGLQQTIVMSLYEHSGITCTCMMKQFNHSTSSGRKVTISVYLDTTLARMSVIDV